MITSLTIQNIALISRLSVEFKQRLTVLTGETGAGKSIIIDSLAFVLGERADKTMIKHGEDSAYVEVVFDVKGLNATADKLAEMGIAADDTLIISRTLNLAGKNECRINGRLVTTSMLKEICSGLVDIFGQSQHQNLFKVDNHIKVLDEYDCSPLFDKLDLLYAQVRQINGKLGVFGGSDEQRSRDMDMLSYQIAEISKAHLSQEEEDSLLAQKLRIANAERIATALSGSIEALSGEAVNVLNLLNNAYSCLSPVTAVDASIAQLYDRLKATRIELDDINATLEQLAEQTDFDPRAIDAVENRLELYKSLKRKYGKTVQEVLDFCASAQQRYDVLDNAAEEIAKLTKQKTAVIDEMYQLCQQLSQHRRVAAKRLEKEITAQLADLGMVSAAFEVQFSLPPTREEFDKRLSAKGYDKVEFLLSANAGEPLKPLAKVISGGEMSRFMLAIKNITAKVEKIPTMVFDEIDIGISGSIAQMLAIKLANISRDYQCLVITHLPQVAAMGDENLLITKTEVDGRTQTFASLLDKQGKVREVARLTGGTNVGEYSLPYAKDMIAWADNQKNN